MDKQMYTVGKIDCHCEIYGLILIIEKNGFRNHWLFFYPEIKSEDKIGLSWTTFKISAENDFFPVEIFTCK